MFLDSFIKLFIGLLGLVVVLRFVGKKAMSDITPLDLIYTLILGGIVDSTLYDEQTKISDMLIALAIWGILIFALEYAIQKVKPLSTAVKGKASILIHEGKINMDAMEKNQMTPEQLRIFMREQECFSLREVDYLILDPGGSGAVIKNEEYGNTFSYLIISKGTFNDRVLETLRMTHDEIERSTQKEGLSIKDIYYGEWSKDYGFHFVSYNDTIKGDIDIEQ